VPGARRAPRPEMSVIWEYADRLIRLVGTHADNNAVPVQAPRRRHDAAVRTGLI